MKIASDESVGFLADVYEVVNAVSTSTIDIFFFRHIKNNNIHMSLYTHGHNRVLDISVMYTVSNDSH